MPKPPALIAAVLVGMAGTVRAQDPPELLSTEEASFRGIGFHDYRGMDALVGTAG